MTEHTSINARIREMTQACFEKNELIAYDGACNEAEYNKLEHKVVFLLKEVNDSGSTDSWSLIEEMQGQRDGKRAGESVKFTETWKNVARWMHVCMNPRVNFVEVEKTIGASLQYPVLRKVMNYVAALNVKKTFGKSSSENKEIMDYLQDSLKGMSRRELVKKEIEEILDPKFLICCGTFEYAKLIYEIPNTQAPTVVMMPEKETKNSTVYLLSNGTEFFVNDTGRVFLKFCHPAWFSINKNILFAYFRDTYHCLASLGLVSAGT